MESAPEAMARVKWLVAPTSPGWVQQAIARPDLLLIDHAHCERKAAGVALQLMFRYPSDGELGERLSPLAREELAHFERVWALMQRRQIDPRPLPAPAYGAALKAQVRREDPARLLDSLLVAGLIEARSHERMALLAVHSPDPELRELHGDLLTSEARHFGLYWLLCETRFGREATVERLEQLARAEWEALVPGDPRDGEADRVRMHSPGVLPIGSDCGVSRGEGSDSRWGLP
jgi:tRNA-(ms[2]io[6]A)-hydroxylase